MNDGEGYESAMNHALQEISRFIHPDRIYLLETDGITVSNTFEWCAEGIQSEIETLQNLDYEEYISGWEVFLQGFSRRNHGRHRSAQKYGRHGGL